MRVFIIDDEEVSIFIIRNMLTFQGIASEEEITSFLYSEEALDTLLKCEKEELPDIILLDLAMPVLDGWQLLEKLAPFKSKFERCRIHILTSSIVQSDEVRAKKNSMVSGFMHKPISAAEISKL
ncbi:two-component system response regulator [Cesiribacter sp. SM1]|uniref:response regulator n=1 Tax=Cesiribacter sp. SM1 TaxID=2861196 RepID=UPI001CD6F2EF|nr:response regulator [Cesiribacter sp. SM1]